MGNSANGWWVKLLKKEEIMKTTPKFLMFGCMTLALVFTSCSSDSEDEITKPLVIGDFHEGGVIFYMDGTGQHGLLCAVSDQSTAAEWCGSVAEINGADGTVIGTGSQNTIDIVAGCTTGGTAADLCINLTLKNYSDWFLPSKDELNEMYLNKASINATATANGGTAFAADTYWCSTELDLGSNSSALTQNLGNGISGSLTKFGTAYVRAVRAF